MSDVLTVILVAIGLSLLGRETWGWLPRFSRGVIWLHTLPLPAARREIRREEWSAELAVEYEDRRLAGLLWALQLCRIAVWERVTTSPRPALLVRQAVVYFDLAKERVGSGSERSRLRRQEHSRVVQLDDRELLSEYLCSFDDGINTAAARWEMAESQRQARNVLAGLDGEKTRARVREQLRYHVLARRMYESRRRSRRGSRQ